MKREFAEAMRAKYPTLMIDEESVLTYFECAAFAVRDLADFIARTEPYAVNQILNLRDAAETLTDFLEET